MNVLISIALMALMGGTSHVPPTNQIRQESSLPKLRLRKYAIFTEMELDGKRQQKYASEVEEQLPDEVVKLNTKGQLQVRLSNDFVAIFDESVKELRTIKGKKLLLELLKKSKPRVPFTFGGLDPAVQELLAQRLEHERPGVKLLPRTKLVIATEYLRDITGDGVRLGIGISDMRRGVSSQTSGSPGATTADPVAAELSANGAKITGDGREVTQSPTPMLCYLTSGVKTARDSRIGQATALKEFAVWVGIENERIDRILEVFFRESSFETKELESMQFRDFEEMARVAPHVFKQFEAYFDGSYTGSKIPKEKRREALMKCSLHHSFLISIGFMIQDTDRWVIMNFGERIGD
jgi:hypothetical protein